ncbi:error-prone DNA polymerase [Alloalcanivorax xenomutans]|uniref:error-prone DNA polymerase n=1 Tax=Alloalcanivorax xenomutans TaxID=1094342 RepID=UPI0004AED506|nr:error-prone DNA polymerase [Alloalcanivorax xenomutans]CUR47100.1 DNA polymerase III alpha subunit [Alloalcanivorax xenomutans]
MTPDALPFAELHCTSAFSFLTGASQPEELVQRAHELGYRALAITDDASLAGVVRAWRAHKALRDGSGTALKLIIGSAFHLETDQGALHLVLLARNRRAYGEIATLITQGRRRAEKGKYQLHWRDLTRLERHALCLWFPAGDGRDPHHASLLQAHFGDRFWLACELLQDRNDALHYQYCLALAQRFDLAMSAANDVHYHRAERQRLQDVLTALRLNTSVHELGRRRFQNDQRHLRSLETLAGIYPEPLLREAAWIADQCEFKLDDIRYQYPEEVVPPGQNADDYLAALTHQGAARRYPDGVPASVQALLERELALIRELEYAHYFLTVHDIVAFARGQGILCQGRGSAANSAVCYCLGVTEVDPDRSQLLFERFISKERREPPDIDVDFEHERREEVMQYLYRKYGRDRAALAATVIHYRTRSAVRDVGRALGVDLSIIERLSANLAWWDKPADLQERFREVGLGDTALGRQYRALVFELVGFPRHLSQHVGGFVITRDPVPTLVPVENAAMADRTVIQWDKDDLEALGLMKVDVLALGMLTAIRKTLDLVSHYRGRPLIMQDIPTEDPATYDMLCKGNSLGVFQVESRAQMNMLPRLRPRKFYDLVIEVAIVRPGPIQGDMVHPYLRRRDGLEEPDYPDPKVEAVLKRTLGIPIFQEQVIQLVMVAAKFSGGEADQLRRAMARWGKSGELMQFQDKVIQGMRANGYSEDYAQRLFEQMKGFGGYGFPESHSASFALLVYVSAWLKRHHTSAFYCGLLNSLPMGFYSPSQILQDARRHAIELRPLDVRHSHWDHTLEETQRQKLGVQPALRLGFRQLKGFNPEAAERLVQARAERPFSSVRDLCQRARLNQREREALVAGNALRALSGHRHQGHWEIQGLEAPRPLLETERGAGKDHDGVYLDAPSEHADLLQDYRHLGLTLGRHPMALVRHLPRFRGCRRARDLKRGRPGQLIRVAGLVTNRQRPGSAKGALFMTLEDETGNTNVVIWNAIQERFRKTLLRSPLVIVKGTLEISPEGIVHLMAGALIDAGDALRELNIKSRDFR